MGFDDKRIMDCPRLDNIYVYPVEGNQKEIMRKNIDPFNIVFACGVAVGLWVFAVVWSLLYII
jgi:hypothetical protein